MNASKLVYIAVFLLLAAKFGKYVFYHAVFTLLKTWQSRFGVFERCLYDKTCKRNTSPLCDRAVRSENIRFSTQRRLNSGKEILGFSKNRDKTV